jgi:hypothetical protein
MIRKSENGMPLPRFGTQMTLIAMMNTDLENSRLPEVFA